MRTSMTPFSWYDDETGGVRGGDGRLLVLLLLFWCRLVLRCLSCPCTLLFLSSSPPPFPFLCVCCPHPSHHHPLCCSTDFQHLANWRCHHWYHLLHCCFQLQRHQVCSTLLHSPLHSLLHSHNTNSLTHNTTHALHLGQVVHAFKAELWALALGLWAERALKRLRCQHARVL